MRSKAVKPKKPNEPQKHYVNTLFHDNVYNALAKYATDNGFSEPAAIRIAVAMLLKNSGYLQTDYLSNQKQKR